MNALKWILMVVTLLMAAGWAALVVLSSNFRQSFGASGVAPLLALAPGPVAVLLLLSLRSGAGRTLLHATAVVVVIVIAAALRSAAGKLDPSLVLLFVYLGLWLTYYGLAAWVYPR